MSLRRLDDFSPSRRLKRSLPLVGESGQFSWFSRRQFHHLLFRSVVHLDLEHRKLGFEISRPFPCRFKRWKYRLHPAIDFQAKALGHHKVSACDVAGCGSSGIVRGFFMATP
ncbi:hypothetical protein V1283_002697 [Bradyrhizobium sp. AZCC 2262]|uniref:hypothetical protein n=1 Tax=Bradyrhizobium sp. AZCC 2262 TaxID=3117022 RepID=UPI002FF1CE3A